jgi:hypothetical protein
VVGRVPRRLTTIMKTKNKTFSFSLYFQGATELTPDLEDALFEAGCSDALVGIQNGMLFLDFDRESSSYEEALKSAIADVNRAGLGLRLVNVGPS